MNSVQVLEVRRDGPVEYVTLNRPDVRNALNEHLIGDLTYWAETITTVAEYVNEILSAAPGAIAAAKALIPNVWSRLAPDAIGVTVEALVASRMSSEGQEGMGAFLEKRKARWNVRPNPDRQSG